MSDINTNRLAADYQAGATLRQLGRRYGYSHTQIATFLDSLGVKRRHSWMRLVPCPVCGEMFHPCARRRSCSRRCGALLRRREGR